MNNTRIINKNWVKVAGVRALKTVAQTALSLMTIGSAINEVDWLGILSVSLVAGIMSLLTTFTTGINEGEVDIDDGALKINRDGDVDKYHLEFRRDLDGLEEKEYVKFKVVQDPTL